MTTIGKLLRRVVRRDDSFVPVERGDPTVREDDDFSAEKLGGFPNRCSRLARRLHVRQQRVVRVRAAHEDFVIPYRERHERRRGRRAAAVSVSVSISLRPPEQPRDDPRPVGVKRVVDDDDAEVVQRPRRRLHVRRGVGLGVAPVDAEDSERLPVRRARQRLRRRRRRVRLDDAQPRGVGPVGSVGSIPVLVLVVVVVLATRAHRARDVALERGSVTRAAVVHVVLLRVEAVHGDAALVVAPHQRERREGFPVVHPNLRERSLDAVAHVKRVEGRVQRAEPGLKEPLHATITPLRVSREPRDRRGVDDDRVQFVVARVVRGGGALQDVHDRDRVLARAPLPRHGSLRVLRRRRASSRRARVARPRDARRRGRPHRAR
eukprot:31016-Pelagococcus_subviridis.AAC.2